MEDRGREAGECDFPACSHFSEWRGCREKAGSSVTDPHLTSTSSIASYHSAPKASRISSRIESLTFRPTPSTSLRQAAPNSWPSPSLTPTKLFERESRTRQPPPRPYLASQYLLSFDQYGVMKASSDFTKDWVPMLCGYYQGRVRLS